MSMRQRMELVGCAAALSIVAGVVGAADATTDPRVEFARVYEAYREAMTNAQFHAAAKHAAEARQLGEAVHGDDDERRSAILLFNHGHALGLAKRHDSAYPILKEARERLGQVFGDETVEVYRGEVALLESAPNRLRAKQHLKNALKIARTHYDENSNAVANAKLLGGMRLWNRQSPSLLQDAADAFAETGDGEGYALARFWLGKYDMQRHRRRGAAEHFTAVVRELGNESRSHLALMAHANLVDLFERLGDRDRATEHCLAIGRATPWNGTGNYLPLFKRPPAYPREASARGWEGRVLVKFTVDSSGFVKDPSVVDIRGNSIFGDAAIDAVRKFRYAPRFVDGKAVATENVHNLIAFELAP